MTSTHKHDTSGELEELEKLLEKDSDQQADALYEMLHFSPYIKRADAVATIARAKSYREDKLRSEEEENRRQSEITRKALGTPYVIPRNSELFRSQNSSIRLAMRPQLTEQRGVIDAMYTEVKHHARVVTDFHALVASNPESSGLITVSLVLILTLFFAGVIYPLSFMPLPTDWIPSLSIAEVPRFLYSLRGALLAFVSILFSAMLAMFFILNIRMRYSKDQLDQLQRFTHLETYSEYFGNRLDNEK